MNKILLIFLSFVLMNDIIISQNYSSLNSLVNKEKKSKLLKNAQWGLYARYLDTGEEIISLNAEMSLAPASNLKLFTSSAALDILGEDHQFETFLYYDGEINNGILTGDVFFVGGGDPTLGYDLVKGSLPLDSLMDKIIDEFKKKGINRINGDIYADDLLYEGTPIPYNWNWIDIGNYYAATVSALTINNNLYFLYFKPGKEVGDPAEVIRTEPEIPGLTFTNFMKTGKKGSGDNGYIYGAPLQYNTTLRGTVPAGVDEFSIKGSIPDPALFAVQYLKKKMVESGVKVNGNTIKLEKKKSYSDTKLITTIKSPPLKDIVYIINKRSDNLYTEMMLKAIALNQTGEGSTDKGTEEVEEFLKENNINTDGLLLGDGSGLSRTNAITAKMMVDLLDILTKKNYFDAFYNSLAVVGDPNDISYFKNTGRGTVIEKNARVKSGVIQGVRAYSGYLKNMSGRTIAFSLIANNFDGSGSRVSTIHKNIMIELAKLK